MEDAKKKYRTLFLSDIHLGSRGCQAKKLIKFLRSVEADTIYLVGDIIDGWRMKRGIFWPKSHTEVLRIILKKASTGTVVHYIAGNHDEFLRKWMSFDPRFGNIQISNQQRYISLKGDHYLVVHGDMFDVVMRKNLKWLAHVGDFSYNFLLLLNRKINWIREALGFPYWSLSQYLKGKTKKALSYIGDFEERMVDYARDKRYNGVICGHIHQSSNVMLPGNMHYLNTGDWVESCTAIVETEKGEFEVIHYV